MINSYEPSAALAVRPTSSPLAFVAMTTAPATGRGAHCGSGGDFSTGQTGPAEIVPISLGGPPAGDVNGVALGAPGAVVAQAVTATAINAMASQRFIRSMQGLFVVPATLRLCRVRALLSFGSRPYPIPDDLVAVP